MEMKKKKEEFRANAKHKRTDGQLKGQSDMTNLIVAFRNFAKAPKNKSNFRT
jgi:hypothetical protein